MSPGNKGSSDACGCRAQQTLRGPAMCTERLPLEARRPPSLVPVSHVLLSTGNSQIRGLWGEASLRGRCRHGDSDPNVEPGWHVRAGAQQEQSWSSETCPRQAGCGRSRARGPGELLQPQSREKGDHMSRTGVQGCMCNGRDVGRRPCVCKPWLNASQNSRLAPGCRSTEHRAQATEQGRGQSTGDKESGREQGVARL